MEASNVDRIRDLIVGPQLRDAERRFETAQKEIERTRKWAEDRIEKLEKVLLENIERVAGSAEEATTAVRELSTRLEEIRKTSELEQRRLENGAETLRNDLVKQFSKAVEELRTRIDGVRDDGRAALEQLRQDFHQSVEEIYREKLSRTEFAEHLLEIGLRLKGEDTAKTRR
ncbi:MAG: hypothetical protein AB1486_17080 [Planctomycetota bacterium]